MDVPRIVYREKEDNDDSIKMNVEKVISLINQFEKLDGSDEGNLLTAESMRMDLMEESDGLLDVRIWVLSGFLHCVVLYPNKWISDLFDSLRGV